MPGACEPRALTGDAAATEPGSWSVLDEPGRGGFMPHRGSWALPGAEHTSAQAGSCRPRL
jgi:hypothetical protein